MSLAAVYAHLDSHEAEDLDLLKKLVAQPSVRIYFICRNSMAQPSQMLYSISV